MSTPIFSPHYHGPPEVLPTEVCSLYTFFGDLSSNAEDLCKMVHTRVSCQDIFWRILQARRDYNAFSDQVKQFGIKSWLTDVRMSMLDLADAARGSSRDALENRAGSFVTKASTSDRPRPLVGQEGSWQKYIHNLDIRLVRLFKICKEIDRNLETLAAAVVTKIDCTELWRVGVRCSETDEDSIETLKKLQLVEPAMTVMHKLRLAAEQAIMAIDMAESELQKLHDKLGCIEQSCLDKDSDGREVRVRFTLADPSLLGNMLVGSTAEWLKALGITLDSAESGED
jgi:hypothetical protein